MGDDPARLYQLDGVAHIDQRRGQVQKFAVNCSWFQETFGKCPEGADEDTVRRFARAYIMMLLGTQLFADKNNTHVRCRWSGYNPFVSEKGPRVQIWKLQIDMLQPRDFIWMPYSFSEVLQVVHPEALEPRHTVLWQSMTSLIYFAVIEWHQIDRVLPQFGGVQPRSRPALNIKFLMSKDGRGGDRWFPSALQHWHLHWESRADHVLRFDIVTDPEPSHTYLDWWRQHGKRWLDHAIQEADEAGRGRGRGRGRVGGRRAPVVGHNDGDLGDVAGGGGVAVGVVSPHHGGHGGEGYAIGDPSAHDEAGLGEGPLQDYFVGVPGDDQTLQKSTPWFLDEISAIMQEDEAARGRTSAHTVVSHSVAGPSSSRPLHVQPRTPAQAAPQDEEDEIEDEEPLIRRGQRTRVPRRCFTGSHLFR
ncbi:hypothetical protein Ahy_A03g016040 [Arachis hypogaea]|uniref:Aminotransferase-like plant mobile domain-containing protein n=1 Tax=Arachis hypogaea TaxID=3818 RepID=A0A445E234_ARAHY|nr:hypothetical protein Ahy_A03g016040 [Arachis hypogaea]